MQSASLFILLSLPLWAFLTNCVGIRSGLFKALSPQITAIVSIVLTSLFVSAGVYLMEPSLYDNLNSILFLLLAIPLLGHLYFQVFNLSETARRIRILVSIRLGEEGKIISPKQISADSLMKVRTERLIQLGQIALEDGRYRALPKTLTYIALILKTYERVLFPKRTHT